MPTRRLNHSTEGAKIRSVAMHREVELVLTDDAKTQTREMGFERTDLLDALRSCAVVESKKRGSLWKRTVRGEDIDGNPITMIVTIVYHFRRIVVLEIKGESDEN